MPAFTSAEYADMHYVYGFCDGNSLAEAREYACRFPNRRHPTRRVFTNLHRVLSETGAIPRGAREQPRRLHVEAEEAVLEAVAANPSTSTRRIARQLGISQSGVWHTLHAEGLHPYHIQRVQELHVGDAEHRLGFCRWLLATAENDQHFISNVLWTDESTFSRDGINNLHNQHVWADDNPHATRQAAFQTRFSVNVWTGLNSFFLHVVDGRLTTDVYVQFLENTLPLLLEDVPLNVRRVMWYQHDGAPAHFGRAARAYLDAHYPQRWIGRAGPVAWPPRSPDLTPLDFYLWGHMKQQVYTSEVATREELLQRIHTAATNIRGGPHLELIAESVRRRCLSCIRAEGGHFEQLL